MTKAQTILNQMKSILTGTLPNNVLVFDNRVAGFDRDQGTFLLISPESEDTEPHDSANERNILNVNIDVQVRAAAWHAEADTYLASIHSLLMNDATLKTMVVRIRRNSRKWDAQEADLTAGIVTLSYEILYLTSPDQI